MVKILSDSAVKKLEKAAETPSKGVVAKLKAERTELKKELREVKAQGVKDLKALNDKFDTYKEQQAHDDEIRDIKTKNKVEKLENRVSTLTDKLEFYQQIEQDAIDLESRKLDLDAREARLEAQKEGDEAMGETIKGLKKKAEEAEELGYKKGYGDGAADGLREAHKITAEDRKMAMQIAALAAASHVPAAATEIATKVLADVTKQLSPPSTKKS